jgi:NADH-quinone oxidoreductase subunit F
VSGVFGCPTVVNNVETLSHVPGIVNQGAEWFVKLGNGTPRGAGTKLVCVSGDVKKPGYYEIPLGLPLRTLLNEICGGPREGRKFKACYPGGSSSPLLREDEFDVNMDFDSLAAKKTMFGSGAVIVLDDTRKIPKMAMITARFYSHESCGQCVPCREGTKWVYKLLKRVDQGQGTKSDLAKAREACQNMAGKTICVLSDACAMPVTSMLDKFKDEFESLCIPENEFTPKLPLVSGQNGGLLDVIRARQKQK